MKITSSMANLTAHVTYAVLLSICAVSAYVVEDLDDTFMETKGDEIWLIKFYAPWCTFCKELDPIWYEVGAELKSMGSPVHVGRVDATANTRFAKEFRVGSYPAIKMLKDDVKYNYQGPRTKDDIMDFAIRVSGPLVRALPSLQMFQHVMSRHDALFVYIGGSSTLKTDYITLAKEMIVHTSFFSASRDILPETVIIHHLPAIAVFKEGTYFTYNETQDGDLKSWINRERFLSYLKIDKYMLYAMGDSGKLVVLAVVDDKNPSGDTIRCKTVVEKVATEYKELYSKKILFGHMDGSEYIDGLIMGELAIPSIIMLNISVDGYFLPPDKVETEEHLRQFINGVLDGSIESLGGNGYIQRFKRVIYESKIAMMLIYTEAPKVGGFLLFLLFSCLGVIVVYVRRVLRHSAEDDEPVTSAVKKREAAPRLQRKKSDKKKD